jgi:hypothetical protein
MRLFGINIDVCFNPTDIETSLCFEDEDEWENVDDAKDAWEDNQDRWSMQDNLPPPQKVWWRL